MRMRGAHRSIGFVTGLSAAICLTATACVPKNVVQPVSLDAPSSTTSGAAPQTGPGASAGVTQLPNAADPSLKSFYAQKPAWADCVPDAGGLVSKKRLAGFKCMTVQLPVDYTRPESGTLDLAVVRKPATDTAHRIGSLVVDPGGPGGSGVDFVETAAATDLKALNQRYDIVGFDPRGVGRTSPVRCLNPGPEDPIIYHATSGDPAARTVKIADALKKYGDDCEAGAGAIIKFVGTRSTVHDMDVLRQLLGDQKLNYLGYSYGTYLGAIYAETFPQTVGRFILDGAVDPDVDALTARVLQQVGFEKAFERFAVDCATKHRDCPLGTDPKTAAAKGGVILDGQSTGSRAATGDALAGNDAWPAVLAQLYDGDSWPDLRAEIAGFASRHPTAKPTPSPTRTPNGLPMNGREDDAYHAIQCADFADPEPTPARAQQAFQQLKRDAPVLSAKLQPGDLAHTFCQYWPYQTPEKPHVVKAPGAAPILVVGTTGDPATPYAQSVTLAQNFAHATLLTRVGEGHTAFGSGNVCIAQAEQAFLFAGTMPATGTKC